MGLFENVTFEVKTAVATFGATDAINITFCFNICNLAKANAGQKVRVQLLSQGDQKGLSIKVVPFSSENR